MIVIAVSQRVDVLADRNERRDALDQKIADFLIASACLPVPVPNRLAAAACLIPWLHELRPAGVLLSGGNDIGDCPDRDQTEMRLLDYAEEHALPVLGICRGMQMLAARAGATLVPVAGHVRSRHALNGEVGGEVNSFHNFGLNRCPADYSVTATATDGTIEAMRHRSLPWEGWMWHPEREAAFLTRDLNRLKALFV